MLAGTTNNDKERLAEDLTVLSIASKPFIDALLDGKSDEAMRAMREQVNNLTDAEIETSIQRLQNLKDVIPQVLLYLQFAIRNRG